jgi:hypothetical protein
MLYLGSMELAAKMLHIREKLPYQATTGVPGEPVPFDKMAEL